VITIAGGGSVRLCCTGRMTAGSSEEGPSKRGHYEGAAIRVGISACLLGQEVRYDGGHKHAGFLLDAFGPSVEWVAVCPEVEAGFGTPREAVQLSREDGAIRLVTVTTRRDLTAPMDEFVRRRLPELRLEALSGYILKANSPSCGPGQVKVFDGHGVAVVQSGRGLFAEALMRQFPDLPVEDEGRLADPRLLEEFVRRVLTFSPARFPPARRF
jgi:uncharacterized protein YbbK (DUF523 family)